jgi:membrane complex biogenesis BtpA family protein
MTLGAATVARFGAPFGVQALAAANREALAVAIASGASFIRAEAFAYAHVADEGWLDASAGPLLRARAALCDPPDSVRIFADIRKKHAAHAVTADLTLGDLAKGNAFSGADAIIITGSHTGSPAELDDIVAARVAGLPVLVGSGVDEDNAPELSRVAEGLIVGTALKVDGDWRQPVDQQRVSALARALGRTP